MEMKLKAVQKIDNGQPGSEVREILNSTIDNVESVSQEVSEVSQELADTLPLTNLEIDKILSEYESGNIGNKKVFRL